MVSPPSVDRSGVPDQRLLAYIKSFGQSGSHSSDGRVLLIRIGEFAERVFLG